MYEFYGLTFDEGGCPMKKTDQGMVFHPLLAAYLINDYTSAFKKSGDPYFLDEAEAVAEQVFRQAKRLGEAIVFMYYPGTGLSNVPRTFYSALTQSWYIKALCSLYRYRPSLYQSEIKSIFASLMIPIEEGGVLLKKDYGWIVEEYPHEPAFYTLNGWLTVLRFISHYRKSLHKLGVECHEFLERNLDAVEHLLPLYDVPFCLNSRYQLTGFSRVRIVFDRPVAHQCLEFTVEIPGEGCFPGALANDQQSRWKNYLERSAPRLLQFNVLLSLISKPEPNIFRVRLWVDKPCKAKFFLAQGNYRPDLTGMPTEGWKELGEFYLGSHRETDIALPIPFDGFELFAYPTNFKKKIGGGSYNSYHFIHILDLTELYHHSRRESLKYIAEKWLEYYENWRFLPCHEEQKYSLHSYIYGECFTKNMHRLLA